MATVQNGHSKQLDVVIVGGGLVGSLEALYLAKRGHKVRLFEYREDIRKTPQVRGRSINLALSIRGRRALKDVGLEEQMIQKHGIPMKARMIHRPDGTTYSIPYDSRTNQVGSLEALYLAKRGHKVRLFEYREDIRKTPQVRGRSINLALSIRGRRALKDVGLEEQMIQKHGIPMKARMIHRPDGTTYSIPYDSRTNQCIYSVGRNYLNNLLLQESENYGNVERFFNHKLCDADLGNGSLKFINTESKQSIDIKADLIIGADGAFSSVRKSMMKQPRFDFSQKYIEHGYLELCIPADEKGDFQMPPNYLHIWPRGEFMMIALPNQDCSWTVTLFMPFVHFRSIDTEAKLFEFFRMYFVDSIALIGEKRLVQDFFGGSPSPLVAIKCRPYNVEDKVLIIGDAAHAVVPFYGQGMNAGFEDCTLLDQVFQKYNSDLTKILPEFSDTRWEDTFAISDLAMYNYIEMRDLVTRPSYRLRKAVDDFIFWLFPNLWVPLYNSVTFSTMPYSHCVKNRQWQDKVLRYMMAFGLIIISVIYFFSR